MFDNLTLFVDWAITSFKSLWTAIGSWGLIGAFIITNGLLRKIVTFFQKLWKGGI